MDVIDTKDPKTKTHEQAQIDDLKILSTAVIVVLFFGFLSLLWTVEEMRRDSNEFRSQLFIDLIKETKETNTKVEFLLQNK